MVQISETTKSPRETGSAESFSRREAALLSVALLLLLLLQRIMDLLWIWVVLPGFLVCAEGQNLTEVQVELGQHVLLNCSIGVSDIYWYMEIHGQIRWCMVRSFNRGSLYDYFMFPHEDKFMILKGNSLQIKNLTAEDCRLYFCGRKSNGSIVLEEGFRLVSCEYSVLFHLICLVLF